MRFVIMERHSTIGNWMKNIFIFISILITGCSSKNDEKISLVPLKLGGVYKFVDQKGKVVINSNYTSANLFHNGLALVQIKEDGKTKTGYINEKGEEVIKCQYNKGTNFSENIAFVIDDKGYPIAIDRGGNTIFSLNQARSAGAFNEGLSAFSVETKTGEKLWYHGQFYEPTKIEWGFTNNKGEIVIQPRFSSAGTFGEGLCAVADENKMIGYINKTGKIVIDFKYQDASDFKYGYASVKINGKYGIIDKTGKLVVKPEYEFTLCDNEEMFIFVDNEKRGWRNYQGRVIIPAVYDGVNRFYDSDYAPVKIGKKWGAVDRKGNLQFEEKYDYKLPFMGDVSLAFNNGKWRYINIDGEYTSEKFMYDDISDQALYEMRLKNSDYLSQPHENPKKNAYLLMR